MQKSIPVMLIVATAAVALVACSGGKSNNSSSTTTTTTTTTQSSPGASPAASAAAASPAGSPTAMASSGSTAMTSSASAAAGQKIFSTNCSSCHQANGKGQPGVFPPLAGNAVVTGDASKVIHIVKNGLSGKISVNGTTYNGQMPPWKGTLSDNDIASVVSYIRTSWGNHASTVTASQVTSTK